ncbi:MAG: hypothetical protein LRY61_00005 [Burkholderiaceae bacterium]|nr:hypothetical protein [Burkholderiaceae bacterium]
MMRKFYTYALAALLSVSQMLVESPALAQTTQVGKSEFSVSQPASAAPASANQVSVSFERQIYQRMMSAGSDRITYNDKYALTCLIYTYSRQFLSVRIVGLSTYKSQPCDPEAFRRLTAASIAAQIVADVPHDYVFEAGPHVQLMDSNTSPLEARTIPVGALEFAPVAGATISVEDVFLHFASWKRWISDNVTYTPIYMNGNSYFSWYAGSVVYKIVTDDGTVFVMTHAAIDDKMMSQQELDDYVANLASVLNLPAGWRYEAQTLTRILTIVQRDFDHDPPAKMADEFGNIYIQIKTPIN